MAESLRSLDNTIASIIMQKDVISIWKVNINGYLPLPYPSYVILNDLLFGSEPKVLSALQAAARYAQVASVWGL